VDNSSHDLSKVIVGVRQGNIRNGDLIRVYFDTRPRDPGPEFAVTGTYGSEYGMSRMETWTSRRQFIPWECGYRMRGDAAVGHTRIVVPRRCLDGPSRVRVAVLVQRGYPPTSTDWAKARRSWLDWVSR
jgi:NMD protein affecting ribosome stability and mRNA decay